jgi:hypothetical protein
MNAQESSKCWQARKKTCTADFLSLRQSVLARAYAQSRSRRTAVRRPARRHARSMSSVHRIGPRGGLPAVPAGGHREPVIDFDAFPTKPEFEGTIWEG